MLILDKIVIVRRQFNALSFQSATDVVENKQAETPGAVGDVQVVLLAILFETKFRKHGREARHLSVRH